MRASFHTYLLTAAVVAAATCFSVRADAPASQPASDGSKTLAQRMIDDAMAQGRNPAVDPTAAAQESATLIKTASRLDPNNLHALKLLIEAAAATNQLDLRRDSLRQLIKLDPGDLVAQVEYLDYLASTKQSLDDRQKIYAAALGSKTLHPQIRSRMAVRLAAIARERGDQAAAADYLKQALALDDVNIEALRAVMQMTKGTPGQRLTAVTNVLTANPYDPAEWIEAARLLAAANLHSHAADFLIIAMEQLQLQGSAASAELYLDLGIELAAAGRFPEAQPMLANLSQLPDAPLSALLAKKLLTNEFTPPVFAPKLTASTLPDSFTGGAPATIPSDTAPGASPETQAADVPAPTVDAVPATQPVVDTQPAAPQVDIASEAVRSRLTDLVGKNPDSAATLAEALWIEFSMLPSTPDSDAKSAEWFKHYRQLNSSGDMTEMTRLSGWGLLRIGKLPQAQALLEKIAASDPMAELGLARVYIAMNKRAEAQRALEDIWTSYPTGIFALQVAQTMRLAGLKPANTTLMQELSGILTAMPYETFSAHRQVRDVQLVIGSLVKSHVDLDEPVYMNVRITNASTRTMSVGEDGAIKTRVGILARSRGMDSSNLGLFNVVDMQRSYRLDARDQIEQTVRVDCGALADLLQSNPIRNFTATIRLMTAPRGSAETPATGLGGQDVTVDDIDRSGLILRSPADARPVVEDAATLTGDRQLVKIQLVALLLSSIPEQIGVPSQNPNDIANTELREQIIGALVPLCSSPSPIIRAWLLRVLPYGGLGDKLETSVNALKIDPDPTVRMMWGWRLLQEGSHIAEMRQTSVAELARLRDAEKDNEVKAWLTTLTDDLSHEIAAATQPVAVAPVVKAVDTQPDQGPIIHQAAPDTSILHGNDPTLAPPAP